VKKNEIGKHRRCTAIEPIAIIRQMADRFRDEQIAATLNRLGLRTGAGNTWNESRVRFAREHHQLPAIDPNQPRTDFVTLREAAQRLDVSLTVVRRLIAEGTLPASQVVMCAPWQIPAEALDSDKVRTAVGNVKNGVRVPRTQRPDGQEPLFSST
jgi:excisionase family DNA binding protein